MVMNAHFISGLPRSGSTLLCAVLRQNPRFHAAMTSPVGLLWGSLLPRMSAGTEFAAFFNDDRRRNILRGIFEGYYAEVAPGTVVLDTNRTWTGRASLLRELYPKSRIICCVRDLWWIIDSIERMLQKNPLQVSRLFNFAPGGTIFSRVDSLMHPETGLIGHSWSLLREAWFGGHADQLILITYDSLVQQPDRTMRRLYDELGEPVFAHDFENLAYDEPAYDADLGLPGMHSVRRRLEHVPRRNVLPPEIPAKCAEASFWMNPDMNRNAVTVI